MEGEQSGNGGNITNLILTAYVNICFQVLYQDDMGIGIFHHSHPVCHEYCHHSPVIPGDLLPE